MFPKNPIIAIVGAGAVGGYYGARLAQRGYPVHFLLRSDFDAVSRHGWTVYSRDGDFHLPPGSFGAWSDPAQMPKADLVLVALKATANDQFDRLIRPLLHDTTAILTLQNGLGNEERLAELFGPQRILGGLAFVCINRDAAAPGVIRHTDYGFIKIGEHLRPPGPRTAAIAAMFAAAGIECHILDDLRRGRWEKLIWNMPFNGLSAILDLTTDLIIACPEGESLVRAMMHEVLRLARSAGVHLPESLIDTNIQRTRSMGPYRTSMHIDRLQRKPMEVDAILGAPLRVGQTHGVDAPELRRLHQLATIVNLGNLIGVQ